MTSVQLILTTILRDYYYVRFLDKEIEINKSKIWWRKQIDVYPYAQFPSSQTESLSFSWPLNPHTHTQNKILFPDALAVRCDRVTGFWSMGYKWKCVAALGTFLKDDHAFAVSSFFVFYPARNADKMCEALGATFDHEEEGQPHPRGGSAVSEVTMRLRLYTCPLITSSRLWDEREIKLSSVHQGHLGLGSNPTLTSLRILPKVTQPASRRAEVQSLVCLTRENTSTLP